MMPSSAPLRPFAILIRALRRVLSFFFGSLSLAWAPPPWLRAFARHWRVAGAALLLLACTAYAGRLGLFREPHRVDHRVKGGVAVARAIQVAAAAAPVQPAPDADVRDTSKRHRAVIASVQWTPPSWDERKKTPTCAPLVIRFNAPAGPVGLIGKPAAANTVRLSPEVPGVWKWTSSDQLSFEPQGGWMPPGHYDFQFGTGTLAPD